jgi:hypothetical protein
MRTHDYINEPFIIDDRSSDGQACVSRSLFFQ